ncbi:hypothetical protein LX36DRAFT_75264 [Colletotrichum falcatum]|nr:hypothetical protein LX36DRAFT_75264 [Colletotrichum falcatum]
MQLSTATFEPLFFLVLFASHAILNHVSAPKRRVYCTKVDRPSVGLTRKVYGLLAYQRSAVDRVSRNISGSSGNPETPGGWDTPWYRFRT